MNRDEAQAVAHDAGIQRVVRMLDNVSGGPEARAKAIIKAYLTESKWPAQASVDALIHVNGFTDDNEDVRLALRMALMLDPIVQAAIKMRDAHREIIDDPGLVPTNTYPKSRVAVMDAVNEAGL